jgi:polyadenylate-binding protein 2
MLQGYAYIEFLEADAVANALLLDGSELRGRALKVLPKRTNVPGLRVRSMCLCCSLTN